MEFRMAKVKATDGLSKVHNLNTNINYTSIQEAIDDILTVNGHTIFVEASVYYEHLTVNKSLSLIGENRSATIIDGNGTGIIMKIAADNVAVERFAVRNGTVGVKLDHSNNSRVMENEISLTVNAILVNYSNNCTVYQNFVVNNSERGILVSASWNTNVSSNYVHNSGLYGINGNFSMSMLAKQNIASGHTYDGIALFDSKNCTIIENNITQNYIGIAVDGNSNGIFYHNNIINNTIQAFPYITPNQWDDGMEGNYWSNYTGWDPDRNGIGNDNHVITTNNVDHFPLMGMFHSFATSGGDVHVITNSTIESFDFYEANNTIKLYITPVNLPNVLGFCRIRIPIEWTLQPYNIAIDNGQTPVVFNRTVDENETYKWIYFAYQYPAHKIIILIPEFSLFLILPFLMIATLLMNIVYRRKRRMYLRG
jgi:parallel beta-helix repeat protein